MPSLSEFTYTAEILLKEEVESILVEVIAEFYAPHEDEGAVEDIKVFLAGKDIEVPWDAIEAKSQGQIETRLQEVADERAYELYMERRQGEAERIYDAWKEGDR